ncbi:MAG TPA: plastocyanin/azurin family copper-binding protein [Solirubrobacteraceae bacterium]
MNPRPSVRSLAIAATCAVGTFGAGTIALTSVADAATTTLHLTANPKGMLMFNTKSLQAKAGKVTIVLVNPKSSGVPHGIAIEGKGVDKDSKIAQPGKTVSVTATLKKGTYTFYCQVDHHEQAGMKGTLKVT